MEGDACKVDSFFFELIYESLGEMEAGGWGGDGAELFGVDGLIGGVI